MVTVVVVWSRVQWSHSTVPNDRISAYEITARSRRARTQFSGGGGGDGGGGGGVGRI